MGRTRPGGKPKGVTSPTFEDFPMSDADEKREFREQFFEESRQAVSSMGLARVHELQAQAIEAERERKKAAEVEVLRLSVIQARMEQVWNDHKSTMTAPQLINLLSEMRKLVELRAEMTGALPPRVVEYDR